MGIVFELPIVLELSIIIYKHGKSASITNVVLPIGYMLVFLWPVFLILGHIIRLFILISNRWECEKMLKNSINIFIIQETEKKSKINDLVLEVIGRK